MLRMVNSRSIPRHPYMDGMCQKATGCSQIAYYSLQPRCVNMWRKTQQ